MKSLKSLDKIIKNKLFVHENKKEEYNQNNLDSLFECNDRFKNRFYFENLTDNCFFDFNGAKDDFISFYKKIIKSGVGTIILGGVNLGNTDKFPNNQARINLEENTLSKYKKITLLSHSANTKIILKISSEFGRFKNNTNNHKRLKYGSVFCLDPENKQKLVLRIGDNKCNELIGDIARTVLLANISNFDGIMIDASISNIFGELSSQELNKRTFGYFSACDDFLKKTLKSIDTKNNYIILKLSLLTLFFDSKDTADLCKINKNYSVDKIIENIKTYIDLGVSGFEFVFGRLENEFLSSFNGFEDELLFENFFIELREYLNINNIKNKKGDDIIIYSHDNFSNLKNANDLVERKIIDFIDITKDIYSDTNFINNTKNAKKVRNCLKCSYCNKISHKKEIVECLINPQLNYHGEPKFEKSKRKIAVIGSGISGMICALTLSERGYLVDLYEQNKELNHHGKLTTIFGFDKNLNKYYSYIENEIINLSKKNIISIFTNQKFSTNLENINKYYSIVVATGFNTKFLPISGAVQNHVQSIYDCLENKNKLLKNDNFIIYAKSSLSLILSLFLIENEKKVTLIIKDTKPFISEYNANMLYYFYRILESGVSIYFDARITKINEDNIDIMINKTLEPKSTKTILKIFSNSRIKVENQLINIDCNQLIYEPEIYPNNKLYAEIVNKKFKGEVYLVGNALENSNLAETIKSGYFVGKNI